MNNPKVVVTTIILSLLFLVSTFVVLISKHEIPDVQIKNELKENMKSVEPKHESVENVKEFDLWGSQLSEKNDLENHGEKNISMEESYEYAITFKISDIYNYGLIKNVNCRIMEGAKILSSKKINNSMCKFAQLKFGNKYHVEIQDINKFYAEYNVDLNVPYVENDLNRNFERKVVLSKNSIGMEMIGSNENFSFQGKITFKKDFDYQKAYCRAVKNFDKQKIKIKEKYQANLVNGKCKFNLLPVDSSYLIELVIDEVIIDTYEIVNPETEKVYAHEFIVDSTNNNQFKSKCVDSDGINEFIFGVVNYQNKTFYDVCENDTTLREYGCKFVNEINTDSMYVKNITCIKGCRTGICLK